MTSRISELEVDALIDLAREVGDGAATAIAYGLPCLDGDEITIGPELVEAVRSYAPVDKPHEYEQHQAHSTAPTDEHLGSELQSKAVEIGRLLPRLQLAIRATDNYDRRAGIVRVLDHALTAHRELQEWSSRAGEYQSERAAAILHEFDSLITQIKANAEGAHCYE